MKIQDFEADFPQKVSLKILNLGIILKTHPCNCGMITCTLLSLADPLKCNLHPFCNHPISPPQHQEVVPRLAIHHIVKPGKQNTRNCHRSRL